MEECILGKKIRQPHKSRYLFHQKIASEKVIRSQLYMYRHRPGGTPHPWCRINQEDRLLSTAHRGVPMDHNPFVAIPCLKETMKKKPTGIGLGVTTCPGPGGSWDRHLGKIQLTHIVIYAAQVYCMLAVNHSARRIPTSQEPGD